MNCKPGDLAIVIFSEVGNEGRIVKVIRAVRSGELMLPGGMRIYPEDDWVIEGRMIVADEHVITYGRVEIGRWDANHHEHHGLLSLPDCRLRPIRDQDGEDETLTWAGKPSEVTA